MEEARKRAGQGVDFSKVPLGVEEWLARDLPEPDRLMGDLLTTTTRALIAANTGIGKTNFTLTLFAHGAAGEDFLHWRCQRPGRMIFVDGEMPRYLMQQRPKDITRRLGAAPAGLFLFSKEDVENFPPLNTPEGQAAVWRLIEEVERRSGGPVDAICFDSIISLLLDDMKDEGAWRDTLPMVSALTKRQIGQLWVHHTGHDTTRSYGTKTREWQIDTVGIMTGDEQPTGADLISFTLSFSKHRTATPENRGDFAEVAIALIEDQWVHKTTAGGKAKLDGLALKFFEALQDAAHTSGEKVNGHPAASFKLWRDHCVKHGLIDLENEVHKAHALFSKYKLKLIGANWIGADATQAWVLS
jgi:hypothetical protein